MADIRVMVIESIDAPAHAAFEYCRDPRRMYAEDPTYAVAEAAVAGEGVGTTAGLVAKMFGFPIENVAIEYVEVEPDQRIVFEARPTRGERYPDGLGIEPQWTQEVMADLDLLALEPDPKSRMGASRFIGHSRSAGRVLVVIAYRDLDRDLHGINA